MRIKERARVRVKEGEGEITTAAYLFEIASTPSTESLSSEFYDQSAFERRRTKREEFEF